MNNIPADLKRFAKSALSEMDYIAINYLQSKKLLRKSKLKLEFTRRAIYYSNQIKEEYPEFNATIITYSIKRYIAIRDGDNWETIK